MCVYVCTGKIFLRYSYFTVRYPTVHWNSPQHMIQRLFQVWYCRFLICGLTQTASLSSFFGCQPFKISNAWSVIIKVYVSMLCKKLYENKHKNLWYFLPVQLLEIIRFLKCNPMFIHYVLLRFRLRCSFCCCSVRRISPPCFLAGCRKRRVIHGSVWVRRV